ncbi:MAG: phytanoyl-CoA dioxygenase family protein [Cyclobacteriaceae bacterium]|nr:phytanoyl-CoA dioxygenase family protein [Cyclobacteriaceae bacterium]
MNTDHSIIKHKKLSTENAAFYHQYGYLIADGLFEASEIAEIKEEAVQIFRGQRGDIEGLKIPEGQASDFEVLKNYIAIHFPHKISPKILDYVCHAAVAEVLTGIIGPNVKCMQSMLFVKAPGKPGQSWHQDEYYIPTRDRSLTGVWVAIDDATVENGCLWVIPGSQKNMPIRRRIPYHGSEYGDVDLCELEPFTEKDAIAVEVKKGSVVFFNGYLFHSSLRNKTTNNFRTALVSHYMSAESLLPWDWDGRLPLKEDMRDIMMVAGKDPYAHKGTKQLTYPFLRPDVVNIVKES